MDWSACTATATLPIIAAALAWLAAVAALVGLRRAAAVGWGGGGPAPVAAAARVRGGGRPVGALAVSAHRTTRGRLTFAERRALGLIAAGAAALPALGEGRRAGRPRR